MNVPKLRFKEFDGELIEDIIQNYAEVQTGPFGSQLHEKDYVKVGTPIITVEHFGDNRIIHKNLPMVSNEDKERLKKYSLKEGDVVFSRVGSIDRRVYVTEREDGWLFSGRCLRLRIINTNLSSKYLSTYLGTTKCLNEIRSKAVGGTMPSLNTDILNSISINLPQYKEQEKVASFFEKLDKKIQLQQQKIDLLQEQKKGFLQKMFPKAGETQPEMRFYGFIEGWINLKLGDLGSVAMNKRIYKEETSLYGDIPFYKIGTFGGKPDAFISREKYEEYKEKYPYPRKGDLLISASGSIGRVIEYSGEEAYYQDSNIIWLQHDDRLDNLFLKQFYNIVRWSGIEGTTIKRLYNKNVLETRINLPSIEEQKKIGEFFSVLDSKIKLENQKLKLLQKQKQGFMQQMFI